MNEELIKLNKKIRIIFEQNELPESIREKIERVFEEYRTFFEENLKSEILTESQGIASRNIENYFEQNYLNAMMRIQDKYKDKYVEKSDIVATLLSTLESQMGNKQDKQEEKRERDILDKYIKNDKENYFYTNSIIEIVISSIKNSKNQLFRTLDSLGTTSKKIEYINDQITLIENSGKLRLSTIKGELDIIDEQILSKIFAEYEQYRENKTENKDAHQKFVDGYKVPQEELQIVQKAEELKETEEKEYGDLPENIIE